MTVVSPVVAARYLGGRYWLSQLSIGTVKSDVCGGGGILEVRSPGDSHLDVAYFSCVRLRTSTCTTEYSANMLDTSSAQQVQQG